MLWEDKKGAINMELGEAPQEKTFKVRVYVHVCVCVLSVIQVIFVIIKTMVEKTTTKKCHQEYPLKCFVLF